MAGHRRAGDPRGTGPPLPLHPGDQRMQRPGLSRVDDGSDPGGALRRAVGLGGTPALEAPPAPVVDLAVAAAGLRGAVHDLGYSRLAAGLAGPGPEATA